MVIEIFVLIILVALSGFFSGAEIALFSLSKIKVRKLIKEKKRGAKTLNKLKNNPHRMLVTILIGNNVVNIGAASLATVIFMQVSGSAGIGIATGIMTFLILIFGEIVPKSYFHQNAERMSLFVAQPIFILTYILYPIIIVVEFISSGVLKIVGVRRKKDVITEEEIIAALSLGAEAGAIDKDEEEMMQNIIEFGDSKIKDVMTEKKYIVSLKSDDQLIDAITKMLSTHYSRIPVYAHKSKKIIGIINIRNILEQIKNQNFDEPLMKMLSPPFFVRDDDFDDDVFDRMREHAVHMAIVRNKKGQVVGLVTMEDLLEEIVGEIYDESDKKRVKMHFLDKKTAIVNGDTLIDELKEKIDIPLKSRVATISQLISARFEHKPKPGNIINMRNFVITVMGVDKKDPSRILRMKIVKRRGKLKNSHYKRHTH